MLVIRLVEEHVLAIALPAFRSPVLEIALRGDTVFCAKLLPELRERQPAILQLQLLDRRKMKRDGQWTDLSADCTRQRGKVE